MTKLFVDLLLHNNDSARLCHVKRRQFQETLVENLKLLIKLREEKVGQKNGEDILSM